FVLNRQLGERRAQEVRTLVLLQGVGEDQVDIISYGEEKPAMPGTGEASWELNRRVELVF
ncbi:MAG: OmpA family protein, partial [Proteobacteria bacterium]|nr:OmpA family protein [Pseudomonadota bacterium]